MKWGITQQEFNEHYLARLGKVAGKAPQAEGTHHDLPRATLLGRIKRFAYGFLNYPLGDLAAWDPAPGRHIVTTQSERSPEPPDTDADTAARK